MNKVIKYVLNLPVAMIVLSSYFTTSAFLKNDAEKEMVLLWILWLGFLLGHWHGKKIR